MPTRKRASLNSSQCEWLAPRGGGWEGGGVHTLPWARLLCTASRGAVFWRAPAAQQDARGRGSEAREKVFDPPGCMYVRTPRACARHTARVPEGTLILARSTEHARAPESEEYVRAELFLAQLCAVDPAAPLQTHLTVRDGGATLELFTLNCTVAQ